MLLNEIWDPHINDLIKQSYQGLSDDNSAPHLGSLRQTHLTLGQIRKLRKMNDARRIEHVTKMAQLRKQYRHVPKNVI